MIYFGRHPNQYGDKTDRFLVHQIQTTFNDAVKTPDYHFYEVIEKMFDVLYECDAGVFRPYNDRQVDKVTFCHMSMMFGLLRPVYIICSDGSITRLLMKPLHE